MCRCVRCSCSPLDSASLFVSTCRSFTNRSSFPDNDGVETRRLQLLVELAPPGFMREVAEEMGLTTSTVSQQLAILARDVGAALVEPDGRRGRLTPAGHRLAGPGGTILPAGGG